MFDRLEAELGPLYGLVSSAGIILKGGAADLEQIRRMVEIDLLAHLLCNRAAVRRIAH